MSKSDCRLLLLFRPSHTFHSRTITSDSCSHRCCYSSVTASAMASSSYALKEEDQDYDAEDEEDTNAETVAIAVQKSIEKVLSERTAFVKRRMYANKERLKDFTTNFVRLDRERKLEWEKRKEPSNFYSLCVKSQQLCEKPSNSSDTSGEIDGRLVEGLDKPVAIIYGCQTGGRTAVRPVKLHKIENVPKYTTWIYLDRNQRMTEDQSVVGRRRIYYDSDGNETLIASESEEEDPGDEDEKEEPKRDFSKDEDSLIWMSIQELGVKPMVLDELSEVLGGRSEEIEARYGMLLDDFTKNGRIPVGTSRNGALLSESKRSIVVTRSASKETSKGTPPRSSSKETGKGIGSHPGNGNHVKEEAFKLPEVKCVLLDTQEDDKEEPKDLLAAMDSFDNLFCRRCLVFDCRLHGCSQAIVHPSEKQQPLSVSDEAMVTPCGKNCYLVTGVTSTSGADGDVKTGQELAESVKQDQQVKTAQPERSCSSERAAVAVPVPEPVTEKAAKVKKVEKRPITTRRSLSRRVKRQCPTRDTTTFSKSEESLLISLSDSQESQKGEPEPASTQAVELPSKRSRDDDDEQGEADAEAVDEKLAIVPAPEVLDCKEAEDDAPAKPEVGAGWNELEMGLYEKGLQIFGKNSCLIARNLLRGCKTCAEVAKYTQELDNAGIDGRRIADSLDIEAASRARLYGVRRKRNMRKLKYTFKSVVHPLIRKRMVNGKDQPCRQYTPCNCLHNCGRQCPCLLNGTCCEKYCGCSKSCKNRFRGCHCAKSNCCSRQCPCFAAGRECDPDVCRNCWVGCGDGSFGGPTPRGDNYSCHNMKLMLKQQQRVLLGRSDVAGWGAFLKNPVAKHEYLGEYTGELISHREADKRGKIYDRENSSFLFNLNDQYVLDACRKGDKLKFANHSPQPNCYAKVIMVSGDHRVGIFAKERITAGEELFYDYRYEPDRAPVWARKPDDPNNNSLTVPSTTGRAQKAAN